MAAGTGTEPRADDGKPTSDAADDDDDFEFCILSSGALAQPGKAAGPDMCVADELFSNGKLLPLRPSSAAGSDAPTYMLFPRSESVSATAVGFGSRSDSRSASSSSSSSSGCVSRSQSSKSAASDQAGARRSTSSSVFYAHPSPSPQLRWTRPRRSTGSAAPPPPAAWGILRLGVAGAPDVYPPRATSEAKSAAAVGRGGGGGSRSARFEPAPASAAAVVDKTRFNLGLFGDSFGCKCSPDAVEPVRVPAPAPAAKKQSRKKDGARRSRILHWLDELSITKEKK